MMRLLRPALTPLLAAVLVLGSNPFSRLGGYQPVSEVREQAQIVLDIQDLTKALSNYDFATAFSIYTAGRYSCKSPTKARTLQGFVDAAAASGKLAGQVFFGSFTGGNGTVSALNLTSTFWDDFILAALRGMGDFASRSAAVRQVAAGRAVLGALTMYATYELESAIAKARLGQTDDAAGAPHAWDEAWAFYFGGHGLPGKYSAWEFAEEKDLDFAFTSNGTRLPLATQGSVEVLGHFLAGLRAARSSPPDVSTLIASRDRIYRLLALGSIRAALKFAALAQSAAGFSDTDLMEAYVDFLAAAGWVEQASPGAGYAVLQLLDFRTPPAQLNPQLYCAVQEALIPAYQPLGLDCGQVGVFRGLPVGTSCSNLPQCPAAATVVLGLATYSPDTNCTPQALMDCPYAFDGIAAATTPAGAVPTPAGVTTTVASGVLAGGSASVLACDVGCYDFEDEACIAGLSEMQCAEIYGHVEWSPRCNCREVQVTPVTVCDVGCYDSEDEACIADLSEMQCAEIYGHEWSAKCNCRQQVGNLTTVVSTASAAESTDSSVYFSIPAFIVLFRESLEVVLVLTILLQFLSKTESEGLITREMFLRFRREVYIGGGLGFLCCLGLGVGFLFLTSLLHKVFKGNGKRIFEGCAMLLTAVVLSFLALNFYRMVYTREGHTRKLRAIVEQTVEISRAAHQLGQTAYGRKYAFFILAFSTGLREGLESIIFLVGVISDVKDLSSLPLPIITALVLSRIVGCCFFQGTKRLRIEWFLYASALVLLIIAAGFFTSGVHQFQELGIFGPWSPKSMRPWQNQAMWDASKCCSDKSNRFFVFMHAMVGWQDQPTPIGAISYASFWVMVVAIGFVLARRAKRQLEALVQKWRAEDEAAAKEAAAKEAAAKEAAAKEAEEKDPTADSVPEEAAPKLETSVDKDDVAQVAETCI